MKSCLFLPLLGLSVLSFSTSDELSDIYNVIKHVETNNNSDAIGDGGKAYGIVQIHAIAVKDVNRIYGTTYTHKDAFDEVCAQEIFNLYITAGIKRYKQRYYRDPTEEEVVRMWNGSIYNGYKKMIKKDLEKNLKLAKQNYTKGCSIKSAVSGISGNVLGNIVMKYTEDTKSPEHAFNGDIVSTTGIGCIYNHSKNKWAEIVK